MKKSKSPLPYGRFFEPWFILPHAFNAMIASAAVATLKSVLPFSNVGAPPNSPGNDDPDYENDGGCAICPIKGVMTLRPSDMEKSHYGEVCMQEVGDMIDAAVADPRVSSILLDIESPGGTVVGTPELAARVAAANEKKPVGSFTDTMMGSAAYYVGSQGEMVMATPSAYVGSIGTIINFTDLSGLYSKLGMKMDVIHNDDSPLKGTGVPGTSLNADQRAYLTDMVNHSAEMFKDTVRAARPQIKENAMLGHVMSGQPALNMGLIDQITNRAGAISAMQALARTRNAKLR